MIASVASALLSASDLSAPAVRLGLDLLGAVAPSSGVLQLPVDAICTRAGGVSWNRARVILGELAGAGFLVYWSFAISADRFVVVAWLAWPAGLPRVNPPAVPADSFGVACILPDAAPAGQGSITSNVRGDCPDNPGQSGAGRSAEIVASPVVVVVDPDPVDLGIDKQTTTRTRKGGRSRGRASGGAPAGGVTSNVRGDSIGAAAADLAASADPAFLALLSDPDLGLPRWMAAKVAIKAGEVGLSFRELFESILEWRRQRDRGDLKHPAPALLHRIAQGWGGSCTDNDRRSAFYMRHFGALAASDMPALRPADVLPADVPAASPGADVAPWAASPDVPAPADPVALAWAEVVGLVGDQKLVGSSVVGVDGDQVVVALPDPAWLDWVRSRLGTLARRHLSVSLGRPVSVAFSAGGVA